MIQRFSNRQGYRAPAAEILVREDAPSRLRAAVPLIAEEAGLKPSAMRRVICRVLLVRPDPANWSEYPNISEEVAWLIDGARWHKVYDIIEALHAEIAAMQPWDSRPAQEFERRLNDFLLETGIGWELRDGQISRRGSEIFARSTHEVPDSLEDSGFQRAAKEMREALRDISRRPEPDITGALQHAMGALEGTAREVAGRPNLTLGKLVSLLDLPPPLDQAVHKLWGYASDRGRHIREQQVVDPTEAELVVAVAGALCGFLAQRQS
ncbi:MAG: hypothetical protein F4Z74_04695 [Acidobacteria bacterium]|nr:hypothetical protein [Acidobacteriota bacterium]MYE43663.1 hypothetical protein [Acidobacteriota bacterium]